MGISDEELLQLIDKMLKGTASAEEQMELENWFRSYDDSQAFVKVEAHVEKNALKERMFAHITEHIRDGAETKQRRHIIPYRRVVFRYGIAAAASVLIVGLLYLLTNQRRADIAPVFKEWSAVSKMEKIKLDDSSTVWLYAGSHLRYAAAGGTAKREAFLKGEAFFEVRHDASRSFIVHSDAMEIVDIGTKFNVKAYSGDKQWKVTVWEGWVNAICLSGRAEGSATSSPDTLKAGQEWVLNNLTSRASILDCNSTATPWEPGKLYFSNEFLSDIAHQLESRFGVNIQFAKESYKDLKFSGTFSSEENIEHILFIIGKANGINNRHHGKIHLLF